MYWEALTPYPRLQYTDRVHGIPRYIIHTDNAFDILEVIFYSEYACTYQEHRRSVFTIFVKYQYSYYSMRVRKYCKTASTPLRLARVVATSTHIRIRLVFFTAPFNSMPFLRFFVGL